MADTLRGRYNGKRAVILAPTISERLPPELREGLARRRLIATGQPCPCGAQPPRLPRRVRRHLAALRRQGKPLPPLRVDIVHAEDCPATDPRLRGTGDHLIAWAP